MVAVAATIEDVVKFAGGLIYDRVATGWDVAVHAQDASGEQSLRVLGASRLKRLSALTATRDGDPGWPDTVVVEAAFYERDPSVRRYVKQVRLNNALAQVVFCGVAVEKAKPGRDGALSYQLSAAANAFKLRALSCLDTSPEVAFPSAEIFCATSPAGTNPDTR